LAKLRRDEAGGDDVVAFRRLVLDAKDLMKSTRPTGTNAEVESAGWRANSALNAGRKRVRG